MKNPGLTLETWATTHSSSGFYGPAYHFEEQTVLEGIGVNSYVIALKDFTVQNLDGQGVLDQVLDGSLHRTSSVLPIVASQQ